ncbi:FAD-dependent monooxygenase [Phytohabitans flavus]|uniref:FAD-dependent monooxygenase n=1 Tax=Phytohabitans flavus TaxID=1076124 RepID=UPI00362DF052
MAERTHQFVIVGAGPAGLQVSYYLHRAGADYVTLERESSPASSSPGFPGIAS